MEILGINNLTKKIGTKTILDKISLTIEKNKITGLLGPNGAGKTSLMRLISLLDVQDQGEILYNGKKMKYNHLSSIGYMPEEKALYSNMQIYNQLMYIASLHNISKKEAKRRVLNGLEKFNLIRLKDNYINQLSKGLKQKVQLLSTILHQPDFLILDEPFDGLDPISYQILENELLHLKNKGVTILFSSHRLEQVEHFCEQVIMINKGKKIIHGSVDNLKKIYANNIVEFTTNKPLNHEFILNKNVTYQKDREIHISFSSLDEKIKFINELTKFKIDILHLQQHQVSLKDIFIRTIKEDEK